MEYLEGLLNTASLEDRDVQYFWLSSRFLGVFEM